MGRRRRNRALPREVFLSQSSRNRRFAGMLAGDLRRHGVPVWYSETNIVGARQWHDEIGAALERCDWFVVVLSPASVKSRWVKQELLFALNDARYEDRIVPVIHRPCRYRDLSWTLPSFQMIDFTQKYETGCRDLLHVWGVGYQPR